MAAQIGVTIKGDQKLVHAFGDLMTQIPKVAKSMAYDIARIFSRRIRASIRSYGLIWKRNLVESVSEANIRPIPGGNGFEIPFTGTGTPRGGSYANFLNSMTQHPVSPWKPGNAPIREWAKKKIGFIPGVIFVNRYPFLKPVLQQSAQILRDYTKSKGQKKLKSFLRHMLAGTAS